MTLQKTEIHRKMQKLFKTQKAQYKRKGSGVTKILMMEDLHKPVRNDIDKAAIREISWIQQRIVSFNKPNFNRKMCIEVVLDPAFEFIQCYSRSVPDINL